MCWSVMLWPVICVGLGRAGQGRAGQHRAEKISLLNGIPVFFFAISFVCSPTLGQEEPMSHLEHIGSRFEWSNFQRLGAVF